MAVALALIASLCWGVADFMGGSLSRRHPLLVVVLVSQAVGLTGVVMVAAVRSGGYDAGAALPGVLAGLAGVVAVSSFYRSMTLGAISVAAPILATSAIVPVVVGLATGERPSAVQLAGIGAALAGVVLVSREPSAGGGTVRGAGVTLALVAELALGLQLVALDHAARADPLWGVATARITSVTVFAAAALVMRPAFARAALPALVLVGLLDVTANAGFAVATTHGYLSIVAVLGSLFPLVTVALAHVRLHERLSSGQRAGVGLALAGVLAIAGGWLRAQAPQRRQYSLGRRPAGLRPPHDQQHGHDRRHQHQQQRRHREQVPAVALYGADDGHRRRQLCAVDVVNSAGCVGARRLAQELVDGRPVPPDRTVPRHLALVGGAAA